MIDTRLHHQSHPFELFKRHIGEATTILDIGCANMDELEGLSQIFPNAYFHLFEPDPRWTSFMLERIAPFMATLYPVAIGASDGTMQFYQSPDWHPYSGSIRKPTGHLNRYPRITFDTTVEVQVRSLDSWAVENKIDAIDFIWADVQGAEVDLVNGGKNILQKTRFLYTEFDNQEMYEGQINLQGILDMLPSFEVIERFHLDVLLRNKLYSK